MKKIYKVFIVALVVMSMATLFSCTKEDALTNTTWECSYVIDPEFWNIPTDLTIYFKESNSADIVLTTHSGDSTQSYNYTGSYTLDGNNGTLDMSDIIFNRNATMTLSNDNKLDVTFTYGFFDILDILGVEAPYTLTFTKK